MNKGSALNRKHLIAVQTAARWSTCRLLLTTALLRIRCLLRARDSSVHELLRSTSHVKHAIAWFSAFAWSSHIKRSTGNCVTVSLRQMRPLVRPDFGMFCCRGRIFLSTFATGRQSTVQRSFAPPKTSTYCTRSGGWVHNAQPNTVSFFVCDLRLSRQVSRVFRRRHTTSKAMTVLWRVTPRLSSGG